MAQSYPSLLHTPTKRKRGQETLLAPIAISFSLDREAAGEDACYSPRTAVAHRFKGLDIQSDVGGGGGLAGGEGGSAAAKLADGDDEIATKRRKPDLAIAHVSGTAAVEDSDPRSSVSAPEHSPPVAASPHHGDPIECPLSVYPTGKRAGIPRVRFEKPISSNGSEGDDELDSDTDIVGSVRATLTWHDDEITIYDPDDKDDDGTGVNGIGFRPTPAIARARAMKRRQQLTEWRKREESDARARRSQRRRDGGTPVGISKASPKKVRFNDSKLRDIAVATGW